MTEEDAGIKKVLIELKKEIIYKQGYWSKGFVIYGVQSETEIVEDKLLQTYFGNGMEYVSFKYTTLEIKLGALYTNSYKNIKAKYKVLYNIKARDLIKDKAMIKRQFLKNYLMEVEVDE